MTHKHPTPLVIKAAVYRQLCLAAAKHSLLSSEVIIMMNAIDEGFAEANKEHDALKEAMK
jgi:hypothetical protein